MNLVRLIVFGFIGLSIVYGLVWLYSRSVRREKLEKAWDADNPEGGDSEARAHYVEEGMKDYHASIRPKLILLVYIIPAAMVVAVLILTNWN
ncbi:hypothetical protein [Psychromarinibacter halotolerans]|uniref:Cation/multidrug efflux pump n=1 Tax=Psychromarinibacter halotolerans TaxID=1775175 RepID=A0ABV7GZE1_9RHOB|nr:hypothetical protein [Psychromarinibacter halotolerans]MAQ85268.1 hypothetical protein [Maritimibacter sp.]MDF0596389.1 hypothetical protein [Psychromarinibacter halotolerans]